MAQLEAKVDPALVDVVSTIDYGEGEAAGTGIVLTSSGEVVTNNHVVDGATSIEVTDVGNGKTYSATVVGYDVTLRHRRHQAEGRLRARDRHAR